MSLGYAEKLSYRDDVGSVGMSEIFDPPHVLQKKIEELAMIIHKSKHLVAFTGAGISTSCGIPDFRGPKGVWTLQIAQFRGKIGRFGDLTAQTAIGIMNPGFFLNPRFQYEEGFVYSDNIRSGVTKVIERLAPNVTFAIEATRERDGKGVPEISLPFHRAMPSLTHMALVELEKAGILKFVISQNIDSLHLRSGIPREKLAELHGNSFMELCPSCGEEYLRDFEVETIGMKETSRRCSDIKCRAKLKDTVLDWDDALPAKEMDPAERHCKMADVVICLGTSLQITPACNLPLKAIRAGGKIVIVNLQPTPKDKKASLVIHGMVDKVIAGVMNFLNLRIPPYVRIDLAQLSLSQSPKREKSVCWTLRIASVHGQKAPLPFLKSVEVMFPDRPDLKYALLNDQPFVLTRETVKTRPFKMILKLNFSDGCGCSSTEIEWNVDFQAPVGTFNYNKDAVFRTLREAAVRDSCCGQYSTIERTTGLEGRAEVTVLAIVTSLTRHNESENPRVFEVVPETTAHVLKRLNEDMDNGSPKRPKV